MIDAHQHVWEIGRHGHRWPGPDLPAIHRNRTLDDFRARAAPLGVRGTILVQSQADDADTDFLLDVADDEPFVLGVVGWVDVEAPDAPDRIHALARRRLVGLRPMLQDLPPRWILGARAEAAIEAMIEQDLVFDALIRPQHLPPLAEFADRWPDLSIVIDHGAKPAVGGALTQWRDDLAALAARPNLVCKLSGLWTEAGPGAPAEACIPAAEAILDLFGPQRTLWGGDWPVVDLAGTYGDWLALCRSVVRKADRAAVFEDTARRVYGARQFPVDTGSHDPHSLENSFTSESARFG